MKTVRWLPPVVLVLGYVFGVVGGGVVGFMAAVESAAPKDAATQELSLFIDLLLLPWYVFCGAIGAVVGGFVCGLGGWFGARRLVRKRVPT